jgi:hypothetical protein
MSITSTARRTLMHVGSRLPLSVRDRLRPAARAVGLAGAPGEWWRSVVAPWSPPTAAERRATAWCNICRWTGDRFDGVAHTESAVCPRCRSIARDRFLFWCFIRRHPSPAGARVLETSPRLGAEYRQFMRTWFDYRASDFDLSAHTADIQIDLQDIAMPDAALDVVLTPHVLEHVPETGRALAELHRVIAPGGRMYVQVPLVIGVTGVPAVPTFHADNTPVFFEFGWDLTDQFKAAGFEAEVLVPAQFRAWLVGDEPAPASTGDEFHIDSLVEHARPAELDAVADDRESAQLGFLPPYQYATWECRRP